MWKDMTCSATAVETPCLFCPSPARRRGLCWGCYEKFRDCGLPMPPKLPTGPVPATLEARLAGWVAALPTVARVRLATILVAMAGASTVGAAT